MALRMQKIAHSLLRIMFVLGISLFITWLAVSRPSYVAPVRDRTAAPIHTDELKERVKFLSQNAIPRDSEHPENLNQIAGYIKTQLAQYSNSVNYQTYTVGHTEYKNVIAEFGPETSELIVVGAHYDAYSTHPAADDNASGVAGLIELGKLLQKSNLKNRIQLVAYTLEEPPHFATENMGSFIHAKSLHEKNKNVKLMISLEMIGYFSDAPGSQSFPVPLLNLFYPTTGNFIAVVDSFTTNNAVPLKNAINQYTGLKAYSINAPREIQGIDYSDHRNYWLFNYPAVMVTDTSFYRNHHYHQETDTYEKLNYEAMAQVIYGVFRYVELLGAN